MGMGADRPVTRPIATGRCRVPSVVLPAVLLWLAVSATASAELRVLLAFDESGFRVQRTMPSVPAGPAAAGVVGPKVVATGLAPERRRLGAALDEGYAGMELRWYDRSGRLLLHERAADPRVVHAPPAPAAKGGSAVRRAAVGHGAWLARGPDAATVLALQLPESVSLGLPALSLRFALEAGGPVSDR